MVDLAKERELFEGWYSNAYRETLHMLPNGQYSSLRSQHSWEAWTSSASREGYKLVPVEPTAKQNREGVKKFVRHRNENTWACDAIDDIYKAMIGAVNE